MSNTIAYLVMCAVGGLILLIEAHRQFSNPIRFRNQSGYRILDHIDLEDLAARRIVLRGYLFYLGMFMLVYVLLLTTVQLGDMALRFGEHNGAQGELSFDNVDTFFLDREGIARPIYIVLAIIALLSTGWGKKIEHVMRSAAHRLAGVPSGIFKTITQLNKMDYTLPEAEGYLRRTQQYLELHKNDPEVQENARFILSGLRQIDYVAEAVVTPLRDTVFAQQHIDALSALLTKQASNIRQLDAELNDPKADRVKLLTRIEEEKRNLQVLFSVLYFKDQSVEPPLSHPPSAHILKQLNNRPRDYVQSGIMWGIAALMFFSMILGFTVELFYARADGYGDLLNMANGEYSYRAQKALWFTVQSTFIFLCAGMVAATTRSNRMAEEGWPPYPFSRLPMHRLLAVSFLAAGLSILVASVVLSAPNFLAGVSKIGRPELPEIGFIALKALKFALPDALRFGAAMIVVAFTVLLVADQHANLKFGKTILIALLGALLAVIVMFMLFLADPGRPPLKALREVAIFAISCISFLLTFAIMVDKAGDEIGAERNA